MSRQARQEPETPTDTAGDGRTDMGMEDPSTSAGSGPAKTVTPAVYGPDQGGEHTFVWTET